MRQDFDLALEKVDYIIVPTTPTPAFKFGERSDNPLQMYLADIYTVAINLAGLPALSLPAGWVEREERKLPVGLQLIGNRFEERPLLSAAAAIEKIINLHG